MAKRLILAALLLLTMAGCAGYRSELDVNPPFTAHYFRHHDVGINWRAEQSDGVVRVSGTVTNLRYLFLQDLELSGRLMNEHGKLVARDSFSDFPNYLPPGKTEPFSLEFHVPPGTKAEKIHFSYYYWLVEAPPAFRGYDDAPHFGGFVSPP